MVTRRTLLATAATLTTALAADEKPAASSKLKVNIFSKHLLFLHGEELAKAAAAIGFDGIDLAVRKGGHIEADRVREELPALVNTIRAYGLEVPMLTTDIVDADTPFAEDILKTMSDLGIHHYRWGGFQYAAGRPIPRQLDDLKPRVAPPGGTQYPLSCDGHVSHPLRYQPGGRADLGPPHHPQGFRSQRRRR